jgi:hypothetical protein
VIRHEIKGTQFRRLDFSTTRQLQYKFQDKACIISIFNDIYTYHLLLLESMICSTETVDIGTACEWRQIANIRRSWRSFTSLSRMHSFTGDEEQYEQ